MKKEIAIILCMVMLFSLTACAGRETSSNNESTNISQTQNNNQPEENTSSDVGNGGKKTDKKNLFYILSLILHFSIISSIEECFNSQIR